MRDANALIAAARNGDEPELAIIAANMTYPQLTSVMLARALVTYAAEYRHNLAVLEGWQRRTGL